MDFELTEKQRTLKKIAHDFAENEIRPVILERDKIQDPAERFPWDILE